MSSVAIILVNGQIDDIPLIRQRISELQDVFVLGVDGGSRHAETLNLKLDVVVGDMDSISDEIKARLSQAEVALVTARPEKDETDLELALLYAMRLKIKRIVLLGAVGGRLDMTLANVMLLLDPALDGSKVEIWHGNQTAWVIQPPGEVVSGQPGDTLSLIPLGGDTEGIWLKGLAYPLENETLRVGPARGVSNVFVLDQVEIQLETGLLLAVHTKGQA